MKTAWQTIASFVRRDPTLQGISGAHAVLHTHNPKLEDHPHAHLIVPAGAVHQQRDKRDRLKANRKQWRCKAPGYLFLAANLARVFRAKWLQGMKNAGLVDNAPLPTEWVVGCKSVGSGEKALVVLGRYLSRGVLPEKDILSDQNGIVTSRTWNNTGEVMIQSRPGAKFLWLLLHHVLLKRVRRARDYGLLHGNCAALLQVVQLLLRVVLPEPWRPRP